MGVLPTVTYPSHTSLIDRVPPAVHGTYDNRILDPEGRSNTAWYEWRAPDPSADARRQPARGLRAGAVSLARVRGARCRVRRARVLAIEPPREPDSPQSNEQARRSSRRDRDRRRPAVRLAAERPPPDDHRDLSASHAAARPPADPPHRARRSATQQRSRNPEATRTLEKIDGYIGEIVDAVAQAEWPAAHRSSSSRITAFCH